MCRWTSICRTRTPRRTVPIRSHLWTSSPFLVLARTSASRHFFSWNFFNFFFCSVLYTSNHAESCSIALMLVVPLFLVRNTKTIPIASFCGTVFACLWCAYVGAYVWMCIFGCVCACVFVDISKQIKIYTHTQVYIHR